MIKLVIDNVSKHYGAYIAVKDNRPIGRVHRRYYGVKVGWRWTFTSCTNAAIVTFDADANYESVIVEMSRWA